MARTVKNSGRDQFDAVMQTPFGALGIRLDDDAIEEIVFLPPGTPARAPNHPAAVKACDEIGRYLANPAYRIKSLPLKPRGTEFQRRVWNAIAAIPHGRTRRYGELAAELKSAARAVGQACGANPHPLVVPCHRVVGAQGLGGFAHAGEGFLLDIKRWLLAHEGAA